MSSPAPPVPYSLHPPPYMRVKRKPAPRVPRQSSREILTGALQLAQRAVELDLAESDLPGAIAAYDEAIALLHIPLPSHVSPAITGLSPPMTSKSLPPLPHEDPLPDSPMRSERLRLRRRSAPATEDDDDESDWEPELSHSHSASSLSSSSAETPSPLSPLDLELYDDGRRWVLSAARDDEVKEWGRYLDDPGKNGRASASAVWSTIARCPSLQLTEVGPQPRGLARAALVSADPIASEANAGNQVARRGMTAGFGMQCAEIRSRRVLADRRTHRAETVGRSGDHGVLAEVATQVTSSIMTALRCIGLYNPFCSLVVERRDKVILLHFFDDLAEPYWEPRLPLLKLLP
ncbi:hypothetical protein BC826DRAFT_1110910 [Russula brevipes]|nr:hypothetical protein BC826DRAFT_1110910 [Russula brevipes]